MSSTGGWQGGRCRSDDDHDGRRATSDMKVFFSMRHPGALRNFASTVKRLDEAGHEVHLSFVMQDKLGDGRLLWELTDEHPRITYSELTKKTPRRFWLGLARGVRFWVDFLRYLDPRYRDAGKLSARARQRLPRLLVGFSRLPVIRSRPGRGLLTRFLLAVERAIPTDGWVDAQIASQQPDVVLVTPFVDLGSDQTDYVKSALTMGIPTGLCVHSWDNLTNKGLIRLRPDQVYVWNEMMKTEAIELHGMSPDDVVVTGAPVYDQWFNRSPSTTRAEFCAKVGLPADRPFVLYLCSSAFIAPNESDFVTEWIRAVRTAPDRRVREASVLVRPHPENLQPWQRSDFAAVDNVVLWPRGGANPIDATSKNDYYDSIYHSAAAVGVNTSAQIEAGIAGRSVYTISSAEHAGTQEGTLHFHYLLHAGGGLVVRAEDFDEHVGQLGRAFDRRPEDATKLEGFVRAFVRPHGLDTPATPLLVQAVERLGRRPQRGPQALPFWLYPLRWALVPVAIGLKAAGQFSRQARKRERQPRPLTVMGTVLRPVFAVLDVVLRWRPAKSFVKRYIVPRVVPRMRDTDSPTEEMVAIPRIIDKLHHGTKPLIVGPWLSEVGFEVLYWIPFLNWVKTYRHFDPDRVVVVSRGGVRPWYGDIGSRYIDLFDFFTPDQFRARNEQRVTEGKQKQRMMTEFDRDILKLVRSSLETRDVDVLHPMYMYRLFYPYWKSRASMSLIENFASFQRLPSVEAPEAADALPDDYVAVRFYFNDCFPETEENRSFVRRLLLRLTETTDIVLLNPGLHLDDHWDLTPDVNQRVHSIERLVTPRNNLGVQTRVISGASAFIGNYGGLSYLAPMCGVRSLAFYSNPDGFSVHHLELAHRVFSKLKRGSFLALDVQALDMVGLVAGGLPLLSPELAGVDEA